jgi:hypothetical protein
VCVRRLEESPSPRRGEKGVKEEGLSLIRFPRVARRAAGRPRRSTRGYIPPPRWGGNGERHGEYRTRNSEHRMTKAADFIIYYYLLNIRCSPFVAPAGRHCALATGRKPVVNGALHPPTLFFSPIGASEAVGSIAPLGLETEKKCLPRACATGLLSCVPEGAETTYATGAWNSRPSLAAGENTGSIPHPSG